MIIIDSSNYIPESFIYDFGRIPDVFLPIGNTRLINIILDKISFQKEEIIIIVPNSFNINKFSNDYLSSLKIKYLNENQIKEINDIFENTNKTINYIYRLALPINDHSSFENYKSFKNDIPSFGIKLLKNELINKRLIEKKINNFNEINKEIYQLFLFKSKYTDVLKTIDLRIPAHYFKVRADLVGLRFFNKLKIENNKITKTVELGMKGKEEANWFKNTLKYLPHIAPTILDVSKCQKSYTCEYLPMIALSEIYTYGQININYWDKIFDSISYLINDMSKCAENLIDLKKININKEYLEEQSLELFRYKTIRRMKDFCRALNISYPFKVVLNDKNQINIDEVIDNMVCKIMEIKPVRMYVHGDLCLSNILYDSRFNTLKLVDPKGHKDNIKFSEMIGTQKYDMAKLAHSLLGFYDLINVGEINADSFSVEKNKINIKCNYTVDLYHEMIYQKAYNFEFLPGSKLKDYIPGAVLLFLSMLPLHSDSQKKQLTLLGNSIRIYQEFIN